MHNNGDIGNEEFRWWHQAVRSLIARKSSSLSGKCCARSCGGRSTRPVKGVQSAAAPSARGAPHPLVVNVSARHMHVSQANLEILFGAGAKLTKLKDLYQQGEFASEQLVTVVGPRQRIIPNVRILGPIRDYTQIELSYTDGIYLGIDLPLRISGNHEGTPGCTILGPAGAIHLAKGVIRAERHVHMSTEDMAYYGVKDGDEMKLKIAGPCGVTFRQPQGSLSPQSGSRSAHRHRRRQRLRSGIGDEHGIDQVK